MLGRYQQLLLFLATVIVSGYAAAITSVPECSKNCTLPPHPKNGRRTETSSSSEHIEVHFVCNPGFTLTGPASARCESCAWQDQFPKCTKLYPAGCELKKHPQYVYKCEREKGNYSSCDKFEAVGTNVRVTRRVASDSGSSPASVELYCTSDGVLNITLECMKEIEVMQRDIESFSMNQQVIYENDFTNLSPGDPKFKETVKNFTNYQKQVRARLNLMHNKIDECNIYYDLLLNNMNHLSQVPPEDKADQSCNLPSNPTNGSYSVLTTLDEEMFAENVELAIRYVCDPGFALVGRATSRCIDGACKEEFPHCTAACKLTKTPDFVYQCPQPDTEDDSCKEYVAVGSVVTVSRRETPTTVPVTVSISCLEDRTFNLSQTCVGEFDNLRKDFEEPVMNQITSYQTIFNGLKDPIENGPQFEAVVQNYHQFEKNFTTSLTRINLDAEKCDLYLDLTLSLLTDKL